VNGIEKPHGRNAVEHLNEERVFIYAVNVKSLRVRVDEIKKNTE